jgi:hypothetical protein
MTAMCLHMGAINAIVGGPHSLFTQDKFFCPDKLTEEKVIAAHF